MLEIIGKLAISFVVGWTVFKYSMPLMEKFGWWRKMEIGAIIPMLIAGAVFGVSSAGLTYWLLGVFAQ